MTIYQPQSSAEATPKLAELPEDAAEHFAGYAVLGLPFTSGHYLAFRDFPVSSSSGACAPRARPIPS